MDNKYIRNVLVVGNGFDLNLKLKTRYSDFAKSEEWIDLYSNSEMIKQCPLLQFLYGKSFIDHWFDIEKALYDYVLKKADGSYPHTVEIDKKGYNIICEAFREYLRNHVWQQSYNIDETAAGRILKSICNIDNFVDNRIYSFNYTPIDLYFNILGRETHKPQINYVHGNILKDSIILGIENVDIRNIAPGYSFLYKSNNLYYKSTNLYSDLENAQTVVIFGHSLNEFDFVYFEDYFRILVSGVNNKKLYIITFDETSKNEILDNLRKQGISIVSMFHHSYVEFILTSLINDGKSDDYINFAKLLESL